MKKKDKKQKYKFKKGDLVIKDYEVWVCDGFYRFNDMKGENEYNIHTPIGSCYSSAYESQLRL